MTTAMPQPGATSAQYRTVQSLPSQYDRVDFFTGPSAAASSIATCGTPSLAAGALPSGNYSSRPHAPSFVPSLAPSASVNYGVVGGYDLPTSQFGSPQQPAAYATQRYETAAEPLRGFGASNPNVSRASLCRRAH